MPFLRNVTRGRGVPDERLLEVAENYAHFGGRSPLNDQNWDLIIRLRKALAKRGLHLPIYYGNRNWNPYMSEAVAEMKQNGVKKALAFVTSAYSSYSGCRQYREDLFAAKTEADAPDIEIHKIRVFYNHPLFVEANAEHVADALAQIPAERRDAAKIVYTAHSIPLAMAKSCAYEPQLRETARLVTAKTGRDENDFALVYQSRSGAPHIPWLEPDINDYLRELSSKGVKDVVVHPIGFISDHVEVLYDLDVQAQATAKETGINLVRGKTAGTNEKFTRMMLDLIVERVFDDGTRQTAGNRPPKDDFCPSNCCLPARGEPKPSVSQAEMPKNDVAD